MLVDACVVLLQSFDHAAKLSSQQLFSITQAASLRSDLGLLTEAVQGFEAALNICRDFAPALLGLAQTYLASARKDFQKGSVDSATMLVEKARQIALQCARQHGNLKVCNCLQACYWLWLIQLHDAYACSALPCSFSSGKRCQGVCCFAQLLEAVICIYLE